MKSIFYLFLFSIICTSCHTSKEIKSAPKDDLQIKAEMLAHKFIITDGHVDLPYRLRVQNFKLTREYIGIPVETDKGDFDFVRARKGGLDAPFMSIYIPSSYQETGGAKELADSLINMIEFICESQPDKFVIAHRPNDVVYAFNAGKLALPMGMENGAPIGDNLDLISYFDRRGISYITLTHSTNNLICDSSYDTTRLWNGLSPFGYKVVAEMNKVGVMVDISHVSDSTFYQVLKTTKVPVIASHSSARKFVPGFERNMSDDMISKMKGNGGVIMVNFGSTFLDGNIQKSWETKRAELQTILESKNLSHESEEGKKVIAEFQKNNPTLYSDVQKVVDHIDLIVALAGIDHVGFGSDFDGVGDSLPTGLKDVSAYPNLIRELLVRGYSEEAIEKICYKNLFRVWQAVEDYGKAH